MSDSSAELTHDETHLYRVRDGRIAEIRDLPSKEEAIKFARAAGAQR